MRSFVIADSRDTCLGMKLAGIDGVYARDRATFEKAFKNACKDSETGIIFLTEKVYYAIEDLVISIKKKQIFPLITIIPDRHGYQDARQQGIISRYIRESIGL